MEQVKLGKLLDGTEQRDAIHVAIAPVVADTDLLPGQHVALIGQGRIGPDGPLVGIVDPFLRKKVKAGERCWLCLYPQTVTSLRHEWTHPAFVVDSDRQFSEQWLRVYAAKMNSYDTPDEAFQRLIEGLRSDELFAHGSDLHGLWDLEDEGELRVHAERYLGITIHWGRFSFSCSC